MTIEEKIIQQIRELPESQKAAVLDFVESIRDREEKEWAAFSLSHAMRGMEDEETPYTIDDIKESFS
jgi:hypothetical protein